MMSDWSDCKVVKTKIVFFQGYWVAQGSHKCTIATGRTPSEAYFNLGNPELVQFSETGFKDISRIHEIVKDFFSSKTELYRGRDLHCWLIKHGTHHALPDIPSSNHLS
jgi:hypothetical protein